MLFIICGARLGGTLIPYWLDCRLLPQTVSVSKSEFVVLCITMPVDAPGSFVTWIYRCFIFLGCNRSSHEFMIDTSLSALSCIS